MVIDTVANEPRKAYNTVTCKYVNRSFDPVFEPTYGSRRDYMAVCTNPCHSPCQPIPPPPCRPC